MENTSVVFIKGDTRLKCDSESSGTSHCLNVALVHPIKRDPCARRVLPMPGCVIVTSSPHIGLRDDCSAYTV